MATEEFEALEERNKYLNGRERNDVVKSRDDLMQLVEDLRFHDGPGIQIRVRRYRRGVRADVRHAVPRRHTGRLRLENPEDMLTTGVLVEASPAGKRVKQLSLLSGGERSLTALALLLSRFSPPAPARSM